MEEPRRNQVIPSEFELVPKEAMLISVPCRLQVVGPSMAGKSQWILKLIKHRKDMFGAEFNRVFYGYPKKDTSEHRTAYLHQLHQVCPILEVLDSLPEISELNLANDGSHSILILDDLSEKIMNSQEFCEAFFMWSHHSNLSLVYTIQVVFTKEKTKIKPSKL